MAERHLSALPDLTPEQRDVLARAELAALRARIRAGLQAAQKPRERWIRRIVRAVQSNRTTAR
jgi:hypothetical protein